MDFGKMEAGRELDALVAERVMGWERVSDRNALYGYVYKRPGADGLVLPPAVPAYSVSFVAAIDVAEALRADGFLYRVQRFPEEFKGGVTPSDGMKNHSYCQFYGGSLGLQFDAVAETPELAICRAALRLSASHK